MPDAKGKRRLKGYYAAFREYGMVPPCKEVPLGTKDPKTAALRMADLERKQAHGTFNPWTDAPPWRAGAPGTRGALSVAEAARRFVASQERTSSPAGAKTDRAVLTLFAASLPPGLLVAHLAPSHVAAYVDACRARGLSAASVKSYRDRIGIFARWLVAQGFAPKGWAVAEKPPRQTKADRSRDEAPPPKFFEPHEYGKLIAALRGTLSAEEWHEQIRPAPSDAVLADVVEFTHGTGLRRAEVCALRWGAVDLAPDAAASFVHVEPSEGFTPKSGRRRAVPLVGVALATIQRRLAVAVEQSGGTAPAPDVPVFTPPGRIGQPLKEGATLYGPSVGRRLRAVAKAAGLRVGLDEGARGKGLHSLRHTFGTNAVTAGVDVHAVQAAMGHARIETTQGYAKVRPVGLHHAFAPMLAPSKARRVHRRVARPRPRSGKDGGIGTNPGTGASRGEA